MGASGYGPLDADCCCDQLCNEMRSVEKTIYRMLKNPLRYEEEEIRGLCHFVYVIQKHGFYEWDNKGKLLKSCVTLLQQMLDDSSYTSDWTEPLRIKAELRKQIKQLNGAFRCTS